MAHGVFTDVVWHKVAFVHRSNIKFSVVIESRHQLVQTKATCNAAIKKKNNDSFIITSLSGIKLWKCI